MKKELIPWTVVVTLMFHGGFSAYVASAYVVIDFEQFEGVDQSTAPVPSPVPERAQLSDQLLASYGLIFTSTDGSPYVAVVEYHRCVPSGTKYIGGAAPDGTLIWGNEYPITITFFKPGDSSVPGVTDFVSVNPDPCGNGRPITLEAYDICGDLVASCTQPDSGATLQVSTTAKTIHQVRFFGHPEPYQEGVGLDDLTFTLPVEYLDLEGPITVNVIAEPVPTNTDALVMASVTDFTRGCSSIESASYTIDGSDPHTMYATDGEYNEVVEEVFGAISAFSVTGVHEVCVRGRDEAGNYGEPECTLLAVYDPDGGFVTGGGWIDSPAGAYAPDASLTGKANFGFVSKYKKGATTPTGQTEFVFKTADLNFHSSSYQWLVVNQGGTNAQFKGEGTINGAGSYKFMLWAGDDDPDTFRIKISCENGGEVVVYDNGFDQTIGGGSIVVHAK